MEEGRDCAVSGGGFTVSAGEAPAVVGYFSEGCLPLSGGGPPAVTLFDPAGKRLLESGEDFAVEYRRIAADGGIRYEGTASLPEGSVAFGITLAMERDGLAIGWECLREDRLQLVRIDFPSVVSVGGDPSGRLALTARGGRLVDPAACAPGSFEHRYNWVMDPFCGCAVAYNRDLTAVLSLHSLDDTLTSAVAHAGGEKTAMLGVTFRHRYTRYDRPYRFVTATGDGGNAGEGPYPTEESFVANASSGASVRLFRRRAERPETGWAFGMRQIAREFPPKRTDLYDDSFVYKIFVGQPGRDTDTTFAQALDIIRAVWERTGGVRQICYLVGFQHEGHDSMYPDVFTANPAAGGRDALLRLIREGAGYNAIVSFHDNYDDAYMQSPMWDENDIAVDNAGNLLRGGRWNGVQAYWISLPRYAAAKSRARIARTLGEYPVRATYHLDVLTASVFRLDFRAGAPRDRDDDLRARLDVVGQFREKGVDVSSEACGRPFIGEITYFWNMMRVPGHVHEGDARIPAIPFLVHGKAVYGSGFPEGRRLLDALLYAARYAEDVTSRTPLRRLTDAYYMLHVPLSRLEREEAVGYEETAGKKKVVYTSGCHVQVDFESGEFEVAVEGRAWVKDGTAFFPAAGGKYVAYVAACDAFTAPRFDPPAGWEGKGVVCTPLYGEDRAAVKLKPEEGRLEFELPMGIACSVEVDAETEASI